MNITDDAVREVDETFTATLEKPFINESLPTVLIHPGTITVTILDNDGKNMWLLHPLGRWGDLQATVFLARNNVMRVSA